MLIKTGAGHQPTEGSELEEIATSAVKTLFGRAQVAYDAHFIFIPSMVTCSVKGTFDGLHTISRLELSLIKPPELLFSDEEILEIKKDRKNKPPTLTTRYPLLSSLVISQKSLSLTATLALPEMFLQMMATPSTTTRTLTKSETSLTRNLIAYFASCTHMQSLMILNISMP
jgi:hypothetical protein